MNRIDGAHTRTKIVATIGPASDDTEILARMAEAGMDVARLNFAHGTPEEKAATAQRVHEAADRAGRQVAVLQDLPGPKLRIGALKGGVAELTPGDNLTLVCGSTEEGDARRMSVAWADLTEAVEPGEVIYLADGSVRLRVTAVRGGCEVDTDVELGAAVASRQGLNVPGSLAALPSVPEEDLELLRFGEEMGVDMVALSFVRRAEDVEEVRRHTSLPLIAKIEKPQAVAAAESIIHAADCVMVARGDLGIELKIEEVPLVQKRIIALAGELARPVITATQMLESMVSSAAHPRRGDRRRERDPRRHGRGDAQRGDRHRRPPGRDRSDDGGDRPAHRAGRAVRALERVARAAAIATGPGSRLHDCLQRHVGGAPARAERARDPHPLRSLGAARVRPSAPRSRSTRSLRSRRPFGAAPSSGEWRRRASGATR